MMNDLGKLIVIAGLATAAVGALIWLGLGRGWFGQLPGDIHIEREKLSFHFHIVPCVVISVVIKSFLWRFKK